MSTRNQLEIALRYDRFGRLLLDRGTGPAEPVEPVRAFPLSHPSGWVSLCDVHGNELVEITDLEEVSKPTRDIILRELAQREFVPVIERIVHISGDRDPAEWTVDTDRGPTRLVLNSEDDLRRLSEQRILVTDASGVRFLIPDLRQLDSASRRHLYRYL